jgi:hypothetical protein
MLKSRALTGSSLCTSLRLTAFDKNGKPVHRTCAFWCGTGVRVCSSGTHVT